jgi:hypothetical protein
MTQATTSSSSAASTVVAAAERIQFADPHHILQRLEKEAIKEDWQLEYLDSVQWQVLEVPMGLVSSIRRCLEERKRSRSSSATDTRSPIPRIQSIFMSPKIETSYTPSELMTSHYSNSSNNFQDSPSTLHPPSMPTRKSSTSIPDQHQFTDFREWTGDLNDLSPPPVAPKRIQSVDTVDLDLESEAS